LTTHSIQYLKTLASWDSNELAAYDAKHTGLPFISLSNKQQAVALATIIMEISVISGCPIPANQVHYKMLENELMKFFKENTSFSKLTFDEVKTAFRFNSIGAKWEKVKHYQNPINLDYVADVLSHWIAYSSKVKKKAERELLIKDIYDLVKNENLSDEEIILQAKNIYIVSADYLKIESRSFDILKFTGAINPTDIDKERISQYAAQKADFIGRAFDPYMADTDLIGIKNKLIKKIATAEYFIKAEKLTADIYESNIQREIKKYYTERLQAN